MSTPVDPAAPDRWLDRPTWAPDWVPVVDDVRDMRILRGVVMAVLFVGLGACVTVGAGTPPDPVLREPVITMSTLLLDPAPPDAGQATPTAPASLDPAQETPIPPATTPAS